LVSSTIIQPAHSLLQNVSLSALRVRAQMPSDKSKKRGLRVQDLDMHCNIFWHIDIH